MARFLLAAAGFHRGSYWLPRASRRVAPEVACGRRPLGGGDFERRRARHGGGGGGPAAGPAPPGERGAAVTLPPLSSPRPPSIHAASPSGAGLEAGGRRRLVRAAAARLHRGLRPPQRHSAPAPAALALWYVPCLVCASPPSGFLSGGSS